MVKKGMLHYNPTKYPFRVVALYKYIVACGRKKWCGNPNRMALRWTDNKKEVKCKKCKQTDIYLS